MNGWVLIVDCNHENHTVTRKNWGKYNISVDFVCSIEEASRQLYMQDYLLIIIISDNLSYLSQLPSLCDSTKIPLIVLSTVYDHTEKLAVEKAGVTAYLGDINLDATPSCAWFLICQFNQKRKTPRQLHITTFRNILLCEQCFVVFVNNSQLNLTPKEFSLMLYLLDNAGLVMSYTQIYENVWSQEDNGQGKRAVIRLVNRIHQKLTNILAQEKLIQSVWDSGYKIDVY